MYTDDLVEAANRLLAVTKKMNPDAGELKDALVHAKVTLEQLLREPDFIADLRKLDKLATDSNDEYQKILSTFARFQVFFKTEQEFLMKEGLDRGVVTALEHEATMLRIATREQTISEQQVIRALNNLIHQLSSASNSLHDTARNQEIALRASQGVFGAATATINIKGIVLDIVLPGSSVLASVGVALFLMKDATGKEPIMNRLYKFFRNG